MFLARLTDILINRCIQNAYVSEENRILNEEGRDTPSKWWVLFWIFQISLAVETWLFFLDPEVCEGGLVKMGAHFGRLGNMTAYFKYFHEQSGYVMDESLYRRSF